MQDFKRNPELQALGAIGKRLQDGTADAPITNTSAQHAAEHLLDAMNNGSEGFIEAQEAAGQAELVKAAGTRLPADGALTGRNGHGDPFDWSQWGITVGEVVEGDDIWVEAELPPGWQIKASDHSMWSHIEDDKGRERAGIFYKAAFYDRSAHISPTRRYQLQVKSTSGDEWSLKGAQVCLVLDAGKEIHRIGPFESKPEPKDRYSSERWRAYDIAQDAGQEYMAENYPDYNDPSAYWDAA